MSELPEVVLVGLPGEVLLEFRLIREGEFRMGSCGGWPVEEPVHRVIIPQPFYMGIFPVTQVQYRAMAAECLAELRAIEGNAGIDPSHMKGDLRPVEDVSWEEAVAVAQWLTASGRLRKAGLGESWEAGLPSEAMWEYACRAGTETEYWRGDGAGALGEVGWYLDNFGGGTHPVGELPANPWGLYDMHGNVEEWCADVWDAKAYRKRKDGWFAAVWTGDDAGDDVECYGYDRTRESPARVLRGGSWGSAAWVCRSACRDRRRSADRSWHYGFRLCLLPCSGEAEREVAQAG